MIEKILERLEEEETKWNDIYELDRDRGARNHYAAARKRAFTEAIQIVQEVAKEYGNASDTDLTVVSALPSLYPLQKFEEEAIHKVVASAKDGGREKINMAIKKNTHIVIKREDAFKYLEEPECQTLEELLCKIIRGRAKDNKKPCNSYYIVNRDEPYAEIVKGVILGGEHAKSAPYQKGEPNE